MKPENQDNAQSKLKQLWGGGKVPPLTPEQTSWALYYWQKIKKMKQESSY